MEPGNSDAVTWSERLDAASDLLDHSDNFVSRRYTDPVYRQITFGHMEIGAAHPARENSNQNFADADFRAQGPYLDQGMGSDRSGVAYLPRCHRYQRPSAAGHVDHR